VIKRITIALAVIAALALGPPVIHHVLHVLTPAQVVNRDSAAWKARVALIARAKIFVTPAPTVSGLDLSRPLNDPRPFDPATLVECRYVPKPITGTTPKFFCRLPDGDVIKVKYGPTPERLAETAATRLLSALGFGADRVTLLPRLRCLGCPAHPYETRQFAERYFLSWLLDLVSGGDTPQDFTWVSAERKLPGRAIEVDGFEGWDYYELDGVDPSKGGATKAEVDAVKLIAIFLRHWDNKSSNQRLVCEEGAGGGDPSAPCAAPLLMLQDVGSTFGPSSVDESHWAGTPIWADAGRCLVALDHSDRTTEVMPISEAGRQLLANKLTQLSEAQITTIFTAAGFADPPAAGTDGRVTLWVKAFEDRVRQIADRPACQAR
jgi:hypothetical protein